MLKENKFIMFSFSIKKYEKKSNIIKIIKKFVYI